MDQARNFFKKHKKETKNIKKLFGYVWNYILSRGKPITISKNNYEPCVSI